MRVVVTGGAGFIGHHLVRDLVAGGASVLVIDDLSSGSADRLPPEVQLARIDITDGDVRTAIGDWQPSTVFHLAAQVSVPRSEADPEHDVRVNALGTLRVLAAARDAGVRRVVFTSSGGAVYGETHGAATEASPEQPASYYGMHKLLAERYAATSGLSYAIARPSNVYGPGQAAGGDGAVVPAFVGAIRAGRPLTIYGDGTQSRDFVYVDDVVAALKAMGDSTRLGVWNVSSAEPTTVLELVQALEELTGQPLERVFLPPRPGDVHTSLISSTRLRELGWSPRSTLRDGLTRLLRSAAD